MAERNKSWSVIDQNWKTFADLPRQSEAGRQIFNRLKSEYQAWRDVYVELDGLINRMIQNSNPSDHAVLMAQYRQTVSKMIPISDTMSNV